MTNEAPETWSWGKFFKGFFDGKNYAKALVLMFCGTVILIIVFSVASVIKSRFGKPTPPTEIEQIGTNTGTVNKTDSHDSTEKKGWQLLGGLIQINN